MRATGQHAENHAEKEERRVLDLPGIEREVSARWVEMDIVGRILTQPETQTRATSRPVWSCYAQPSPAAGVPDIGYAHARTISDLYARFKTMQGMTVPRGHGWDCHGLGVEVAVARELGLSEPRLSEPRLSELGISNFGLSESGLSRPRLSEPRLSDFGQSEIGKSEIGGIEEYGVGRFVARCRESALRHANAFASVAERMGCLTDPRQTFRTMDPSYVESVWWSLKRIFDAGLLVKVYRIGRYCPSCRTALAEHEVRGRQAFSEVAGTAVIVRLRIEQLPDGACPQLADADLLAWTGTPWMLAANTGAAVHPDGPYVIARRAGHGDKVVLAEARFARVLGDGWHVVATIGGSELAGVTYRRPFQPPVGDDGDACLVVADRGVRTGAGTGIVQLASAYGGGALPRPSLAVDPIGADGCFGPGARSLAGRFFAEADPAVVADLSDRGLLFAAAPHRRAQPHCWRCGTPLLTRALSAWFIRTSAIHSQLREQAEQVIWVTGGRDRRPAPRAADWAVGRTRYWGVPLPIWECGRGHLTCAGSLTELSELAGRDLTGMDPHRPVIDEVAIRCRDCGARARRVAETLDASYDAGAMPFAQYGSPLRGSGRFAAGYPAKLAVKGGSEASNWCEAMMVVSALCAGQVPFHAAICPGSALDERGRPMTGRQGNLAEPTELIERHGADAMRWYFASMTPRPTYAGVPDAAISRLGQQVLGAYLGSVRFFLEQANSAGRPGRWPPDRVAGPPMTRSVLDQWLLSELHSAVGVVTAALETFRPDFAAQRIRRLIGDLTGWYVPLSRRRFADLAADDQVVAAGRVLHHCLDVLTRLMAPIAPFASDHGWNLIKDQDAPSSVHLATWPARLTTLVDERLNEQMAQVRAIVGVGKAARAAALARSWQPLATARLACEGSDAFKPELLALIAEELNVKAVEVGADDLKASREEAGRGDWLVVSRRAGSVALDLAITPELRREGLARKSIKAIKDARRQGGLHVSDRIALRWATRDDEVGAALTEFSPMISQAVLATEYCALALGHKPDADAIEYASPEVGATFWLTSLGSDVRSPTA
jgi:isoleucyl-tRNA synthetase